MMEKTHSWTKPLIFLILIGGLFLLTRYLDLGTYLAGGRQWIQSYGIWGVLFFGAVFILAVAAAFPGSIFSILSGTLFGSGVGLIVASIGWTIGCGVAFLISRYLAREFIVQRLAGYQRFRRLEQLTREHGAAIIAVTRLSAVFPYNILNYLYGLTNIPFRTYLFWSWLGMLPETVILVIGADAFTQGLTEGKFPWPLMGILIPVAVLTALLVYRLAKRLRS